MQIPLKLGNMHLGRPNIELVMEEIYAVLSFSVQFIFMLFHDWIFWSGTVRVPVYHENLV